MGEQSAAPLYEALCRHAAASRACLHIPGHGQGRSLRDFSQKCGVGRSLLSLDLTELPGLDDLHHPEGAIARAQQLAAGLYGAERTFFLVNGTTSGIHALLMATAGQAKVIVPRTAHRAVLGGLILSGADPVYLEPVLAPGSGLDCGPTSEQVEQALREHPDAAAVLLARPSYYGVAADLGGTLKAARQAGKPLLVDEAHGAHLRFHRDLPQDAMAAGADASVQSTHKLGGSLGQSSLLHLGNGLVQADRVGAALRLMLSTSPSYLLMASLDLARRRLALHGESMLARVLELADGLRRRLSRNRFLRPLSQGDLTRQGCRLDLTKLVVPVSQLGLTGHQVRELLASDYRVYIEMADPVNIVAFITIGTASRDCAALAEALEDIAARHRTFQAVEEQARPVAPVGWKKILRPRDAWFAPAQEVPLDQAVNRISAEMIAVFPPGVPVLCPGEEITGELAGYLRQVKKMRMHCQGPSDPELKTIKVVIE